MGIKKKKNIADDGVQVATSHLIISHSYIFDKIYKI